MSYFLTKRCCHIFTFHVPWYEYMRTNVCQYTNWGVQSTQYKPRSDKVLKSPSFMINTLLKTNGMKILLKQTILWKQILLSFLNMSQTTIFHKYIVSQIISSPISFHFVPHYISFHNISHFSMHFMPQTHLISQYISHFSNHHKYLSSQKIGHKSSIWNNLMIKHNSK